eukprot:358164-Chlamydomonas_euryale.AAC.1
MPCKGQMPGGRHASKRTCIKTVRWWSRDHRCWVEHRPAVLSGAPPSGVGWSIDQSCWVEHRPELLGGSSTIGVAWIIDHRRWVEHRPEVLGAALTSSRYTDVKSQHECQVGTPVPGGEHNRHVVWCGLI